jgi:RNA polymerase sigma factor (sigma-70 family)
MIRDTEERENDRRLLSECISGDRAAHETFIRRFSDLVYRAVQQVLRMKHFPIPASEMEDLHNTVFVGLFDRRCKKLRQYRGDNGCSLASWIRLVTVRTVLDQLRRARVDALTQPQRLAPLEVLLNAGAENPEPGLLLDKEKDARVLREGLKALSARDRLFLRLHFLEGLSIAEVAGILKLSESNAYSLKHRAIKRLKAKIADRMPGQIPPTPLCQRGARGGGTVPEGGT